MEVIMNLFQIYRLTFILFFISTTVAVTHERSSSSNEDLDHILNALIERYAIATPDPGPPQPMAKIKLGQALFFDRELSGNRDTACATCHFPMLGTGDMLPLSVGTKPQHVGSLGADRGKGEDRDFAPRNAPEVFNRGSVLWSSQFWDGRVSQNADDTFNSPAGEALLPGLESVLSVQAMFPVTSRLEMRGKEGDQDIFGRHNELADIPDQDLQSQWTQLMLRLLAIPEYQDLFSAAYPEKPQSALTFADAANAIAAFEIDAFTFLDSPWDQYLSGNTRALSNKQKRGAILFFGQAGCVNCHAGPLLTDQGYYNIGIPQFGPGKGAEAPMDMGRFLETGDPLDSFKFRTTPLRNVADTGPWMHNGAYHDLRDAIEHHAAPVLSLLTYDPRKHLDEPELRSTLMNDLDTLAMILSTLDSELLGEFLPNRSVIEIEAFLEALSAPNLHRRLETTIPESVPSGLPIDGIK
jgi:cytochrome c peroxidase